MTSDGAHQGMGPGCEGAGTGAGWEVEEEEEEVEEEEDGGSRGHQHRNISPGQVGKVGKSPRQKPSIT